MAIRPLQDRIAIKQIEEETVTLGGIVLLGSDIEKPCQGTIVAAGIGKPLEDGTIREMSLKVGDKVLFANHTGHNVKINGEELIIMHEEEIMGIIG